MTETRESDQLIPVRFVCCFALYVTCIYRMWTCCMKTLRVCVLIGSRHFSNGESSLRDTRSIRTSTPLLNESTHLLYSTIIILLKTYYHDNILKDHDHQYRCSIVFHPSPLGQHCSWHLNWPYPQCLEAVLMVTSWCEQGDEGHSFGEASRVSHFCVFVIPWTENLVRLISHSFFHPFMYKYDSMFVF